MSLFATWSELGARLPDAPIELVLFVKWTAVLALAWLAHATLVGRNPRWRVALWRSTVIGVVLVAILSFAPPIVRYRFAAPEAGVVEVPPRASYRSAITTPALPRASRASKSAESIAAVPPSAHTMQRAAETRPATTNPALVVAAAPTAAETDGPWWNDRIARSLWSIWLAGVIVLTARLILASRALARIIRRSSDVPDAVVAECRTIADRLGCRGPVAVRRTAEIAIPCLAGLWRPVVLLPERECDVARPEVLRAILAHELAHARNHDLGWNLAIHVASILLWFHPLAWRLRAAHVAACDAVGDAIAADLLGDVAAYGRTLARLAVRSAWPPVVHGLAMARTSDVRRRIDALNRMVFRAPLSSWQIMPALFAAGVSLVLVGGFAFIRAEQATAPGAAGDAGKSADEKTPKKLTLRAVAAETGLPIEGVSVVHRRSRPDGKNHEVTVTTGKDGTATIDYPPDFRTGYFEITARKPKLVPLYLLWDDKRRPVELPASKELRFEPGTNIGGIVRDEAGRPIAGAAVSVHAPPTEYEGMHHVFSLGKLETDARGRWRLDVAPRNLGEVYVNIEHPRYRRNGGRASRDLDSLIVLTKGLTVTGRVVDGAGRPVKGARAVIGHDTFGDGHPAGTTNERGEFTLENCDAGPTKVTVQAGGFAPVIRDVRVEERTAPVEIQLTEPGSVLRGKIVDIQGKPVAGAFVGADTWRGHRSLGFHVRTDKDGRFEWKNAPSDVVLYDAGRLGYMSTRQVPLIASNREQIITLYPELVISGRVSDAPTGRPLPTFRLVQGWRWLRGSEETHWAENEAVVITDGRYDVRFSEPAEPFFVRVEAPGYQPAVSRAFQSTEGSQTFDFALQRTSGSLSGIVVLPDGKPAKGADVMINTETMGWLMQAGILDRRANVRTVRTEADGRFAFSSPDQKYLLIAMGDPGYAHAAPDEIARSGKLVLQPWGKIEGELRIGGKLAPNQQIDFQPVPFQRDGRWFVYSYGYTTTTDRLGRFAFERVVPGPGTVTRSIPSAAQGGLAAWGWQQPIEVKPGRTARVQFGARGRTVTGRVALDGTPESPVDWPRNRPVVLQIPFAEVKDQLGFRQYGAHIDKDGRFQFEDVPPGRYVLELTVDGSYGTQLRDHQPEIGMLRKAVTVPQAVVGQTVEPIHLGEITVELYETLKVGDRAPDFKVPRIVGKGSGDQIELADYRGKLVLLDYWATWCGPCRAEMPAVKDIQQTFGGDSRFQLVGISCDETAEAAEQYIKQNGLIWTHGFAGNFFAGASAGKAYKVRGIPATFLIGPDGRILAKDLRGAELKEAVRKALDDPKLFPPHARKTE